MEVCHTFVLESRSETYYIVLHINFANGSNAQFLQVRVVALATQVARDKLVALGTAIGKFTHSSKFRLTIGCLDILA